MATRPPRELPTKRILGDEGRVFVPRGSAFLSSLLLGDSSGVDGTAVMVGGVLMMMVC